MKISQSLLKPGDLVTLKPSLLDIDVFLVSIRGHDRVFYEGVTTVRRGEIIMVVEERRNKIDDSHLFWIGLYKSKLILFPSPPFEKVNNTTQMFTTESLRVF